MFQFPINPIIGQQFVPVVGVTYVWNGTGWILLGNTPASVYPPGVIVPYAGVAPLPFAGWVLCDGASYTTAAQAALFAVLGYTYGGAGLNFNVPDLRGRVIAGLDSMGGVPAGRITTAGSGIDGTTLGAAGGAQGVTLTTAQLASHAHATSVSDPTHVHGVTDPTHAHTLTLAAQTISGGPSLGAQIAGSSGTDAALTNISIQANATGISVALGNTGGDAAHANVQPTMMLNYIIKT